MNRLLIDGPAANTAVQASTLYYDVVLIEDPPLKRTVEWTGERPPPPLSRRKGRYQLEADGHYHWQGWL